MNKIISVILAFSLLSSIAYGNCDYSKIISNPDGTYTYSKALHLCVGQAVQDNATKDQQIQDLTKAYDFKTLATTKADARADLWEQNSLKLETTVQTIETTQKRNDMIWFGLGALSVFAAGMATASLTNRH